MKKINGKETVTHIWWCEACRSKVTSVSPRYNSVFNQAQVNDFKTIVNMSYWIVFYLLQIQNLLVKDDTGESHFLLLDSIATRVVPASATTLLNGSWDEVNILSTIAIESYLL